MIKNYINLFFKILFQEKCLICGKSIYINKYNFSICSNCLNNITVNKRIICSKCSVELISKEKICNRCLNSDYIFKSNFSLFNYDGIIKELIDIYKFNNIKNLAYFFYNYLYEYYFNSTELFYIVPIPCSPSNLNKRGWDQVFEICKILSKNKNIKIIKSLKRKQGVNQKILNKNERIFNIKNSFYINNKIKIPEKLILIDDIFTTGSTVNEISKLLINKGVKEIKVITIAMDLCD